MGNMTEFWILLILSFIIGSIAAIILIKEEEGCFDDAEDSCVDKGKELREKSPWIIVSFWVIYLIVILGVVRKIVSGL